jgi:hypothetical protein
MSLRINVLPNHLASSKSPYFVRSENSDVVDYDRLVDLMAKDNTTITRADILATLAVYREVLQGQLAEGKSVKTPTGIFFVCASGCLESIDDSFTPGAQDKNHELRIHHRPDRDFEASVMAELLFERRERPDQTSPVVRSLTSASTKAEGETRPGDIIQVRGLRLKFDPAQEAEGLFFVDAANVQKRAVLYPRVQPGELIAAVPPDLAAGTYTVVLRNRPNGKDLKEGRKEGIRVLGA